MLARKLDSKLARCRALFITPVPSAIVFRTIARLKEKKKKKKKEEEKERERKGKKRRRAHHTKDQPPVL